MDKIRKAYIEMLTESDDSKAFSDSVKTLESDLLQKHPQLHRLSLYKSGDDVKLDTIIVKKEHRKAGVGSAVLADIKDFADKHSKRVVLTAGVRDSHWGTTSQSRLYTFYRRNGFVANKGRNKDYSISATHYYDGKSDISEAIEPDQLTSNIPLTVNHIDDTRKEIIATDTYKRNGVDTGYPMEVGKLTLSKIGGDWRGVNLHVSESHCNKGLAFHMLKHAVNEVGPIKTSRVFSPSGLTQMNGLVRRGWASAHDNGDFLIHFKSHVNESTEHPMIMLDGELRHENNSLGQPIHHTYEGISNFHKWFGKSKTVDSVGRPHVFYHGTGSDIKSFSHQYTGKGTDAYGAGFYFTNTPTTADTYSLDKESANTVPVYLKVTKPIMHGNDKELTSSHIEKIIRAAPNYKEHIQNFGEKEHVAIRSAVDAFSGSSVLDAMHMLHNDFYPREHEQFLKTFTKVTGYDGVIVDNGDHRIVNVFHHHQIKSVIGNNGQFKHKTDITESHEELKFYSDIPNDDWLRGKQGYAELNYHKNKGISGSVTGSFNKHVELPVRKLRDVVGLNGEESFRESPDAVKSKYLQADINSNDGKFDSKSHPIFVVVNHRGEPFISEGNHRLGYAIRNNHPTIHAEVRYFNGGERVARGWISPETIVGNIKTGL